MSNRDALPAMVLRLPGRVAGQGFGVSRRGFRPAPEGGRRRGAVGGCFSSGVLPANHKAGANFNLGFSPQAMGCSPPNGACSGQRLSRPRITGILPAIVSVQPGRLAHTAAAANAYVGQPEKPFASGQNTPL